MLTGEAIGNTEKNGNQYFLLFLCDFPMNLLTIPGSWASSSGHSGLMAGSPFLPQHCVSTSDTAWLCEDGGSCGGAPPFSLVWSGAQSGTPWCSLLSQPLPLSQRLQYLVNTQDVFEGIKQTSTLTAAMST